MVLNNFVSSSCSNRLSEKDIFIANSSRNFIKLGVKKFFLLSFSCKRPKILLVVFIGIKANDS